MKGAGYKRRYASAALRDQMGKRRGVAGEIFMWKCGGARAAEGGSLEEVIAVAQKAIDSCRSVGIGLTPCTLPAVGHPNFEIRDGTMEVGIGHHGEPGIEVCPLESAAGIKIHRPYVGNYFTSLDMMGATLTVMKLDGELKRLVDADAYSMGLRQW